MVVFFRSLSLWLPWLLLQAPTWLPAQSPAPETTITDTATGQDPRQGEPVDFERARQLLQQRRSRELTPDEAADRQRAIEARQLTSASAVGPVRAPVLRWGPCLRADAITPRKSDELVWRRDAPESRWRAPVGGRPPESCRAAVEVLSDRSVFRQLVG